MKYEQLKEYLYDEIIRDINDKLDDAKDFIESNNIEDGVKNRIHNFISITINEKIQEIQGL